MAKYEEKPSEREKSSSAIITTEEGIAMVEEISQYMNALLPYIEKDRELAKEINGYNDKKEKIRAESNQYLDQIAEAKASREKFEEDNTEYENISSEIDRLMGNSPYLPQIQLPDEWEGKMPKFRERHKEVPKEHKARIAELKASRQRFKEGHIQYIALERKINALQTKYGDAKDQLRRLDWGIEDLRKEQEKNMRGYKDSLEEVIPNNKLREKLLDVIKNRDKYRSQAEADKAFWSTITQAFGVMPEIVAAAKGKK